MDCRIAFILFLVVQLANSETVIIKSRHVNSSMDLFEIGSISLKKQIPTLSIDSPVLDSLKLANLPQDFETYASTLDRSYFHYSIVPDGFDFKNFDKNTQEQHIWIRVKALEYPPCQIIYGRITLAYTEEDGVLVRYNEGPEQYFGIGNIQTSCGNYWEFKISKFLRNGELESVYGSEATLSDAPISFALISLKDFNPHGFNAEEVAKLPWNKATHAVDAIIKDGLLITKCIVGLKVVAKFYLRASSYLGLGTIEINRSTWILQITHLRKRAEVLSKSIQTNLDLKSFHKNFEFGAISSQRFNLDTFDDKKETQNFFWTDAEIFSGHKVPRWNYGALYIEFSIGIEGFLIEKQGAPASRIPVFIYEPTKKIFIVGSSNVEAFRSKASANFEFEEAHPTKEYPTDKIDINVNRDVIQAFKLHNTGSDGILSNSTEIHKYEEINKTTVWIVAKNNLVPPFFGFGSISPINGSYEWKVKITRCRRDGEFGNVPVGAIYTEFVTIFQNIEVAIVDYSKKRNFSQLTIDTYRNEARWIRMNIALVQEVISNTFAEIELTCVLGNEYSLASSLTLPRKYFKAFRTSNTELTVDFGQKWAESKPLFITPTNKITKWKLIHSEIKYKSRVWLKYSGGSTRNEVGFGSSIGTFQYSIEIKKGPMFQLQFSKGDIKVSGYGMMNYFDPEKFGIIWIKTIGGDNMKVLSNNDVAQVRGDGWKCSIAKEPSRWCKNSQEFEWTPIHLPKSFQLDPLTNQVIARFNFGILNIVEFKTPNMFIAIRVYINWKNQILSILNQDHTAFDTLISVNMIVPLMEPLHSEIVGHATNILGIVTGRSNSGTIRILQNSKIEIKNILNSTGFQYGFSKQLEEDSKKLAEVVVEADE